MLEWVSVSLEEKTDSCAPCMSNRRRHEVKTAGFKKTWEFLTDAFLFFFMQRLRVEKFS